MIGAICHILAEYDLGGTPIVTRMPGHDVLHLCTDSGEYAARPVQHSFEPDLYAKVEETLNACGVRQARLVRSRTSESSAGGWWIKEWMPGYTVPFPDPPVLDTVFAHLGKFDQALAQVELPQPLLTLDTVFTRVADASWLAQNLPALCHRYLPKSMLTSVMEATAMLTELPALPAQLVHGDIGPDNVLMAASEVSSIIDFTPHAQPALMGLACAIYWYTLYPYRYLEPTNVRRALTAYERRRPLSSEERAALPTMLVKEALRRVATPLALASEKGQPKVQVPERRLGALTSLLGSINALDAR